MTRRHLTALAVVLVVVAIAAWVVRNTTFIDLKVPMPPRGPAATNPFYGAQRFAETLGARTVRDRAFVVPPDRAVLVLSLWDWDLSAQRRQRIESWVENGGRLVVDASVIRDTRFQRWTGIRSRFLLDRTPPVDGCEAVTEDDGAGQRLRTTYRLCGTSSWLLETDRVRTWGLLTSADTLRAARVTVGRGSVTAVTTSIVRVRELLDGDHGFIFVAATQLAPGDEIHFLSESDYPSLLALTWREGAAIVVLLLFALGLVLWRGAVRFGPLTAEPPPARRSLAEQIRGTGLFALRRGDEAALHAAVVRAVDDAARARIAGYVRLSPEQRAAAIARIADVDPQTLAAALYDPELRPERLRTTIAQLEAARRRLLPMRSSHGID